MSPLWLAAVVLAAAPAPAQAAGWTSSTGAGSARNAKFAGVSCMSGGDCLAVGSFVSRDGRVLPLAERLKGRRWSRARVPLPTGTVEAELGDVSCVAHRRMCLAVGGITDRSHARGALVERWNGRRWSRQRIPRPVSDDMTAVACAPRLCMAVASGRVFSWNGRRWSRAHTPRRLGSDAVDIACVSRRACMALGNSNDTARWDGRRWSFRRIPGDPSEDDYTALSCTSAAACTAVGQGSAGSDGSFALAARWSGRGWRVQNTPGRDAEDSFDDVSCVSASDCIALAEESLRSGIARWDGRRWRYRAFAVISGSVRLSCVSAGACLAVGSGLDRVGNQFAAAVRSRGRSWSELDPASPVGAALGELQAVSCATAASCVAIGRVFAPAPELVERWDGRRWTFDDVSLKLGKYEGGSLASVSCPVPRTCVAVGATGVDPASAGRPLVARSQGRKWSGGRLTRPRFGVLDGVSCPSPVACVAVGSTDRYGGVAFAERWGGAAWHMESVPPPAGARSTVLTAVSCPSPAWCMAIGFVPSAGPEAPTSFSEVWDGAGWTVHPMPQTGLPAIPGAVSCAAPAACVAVGPACQPTTCSGRFQAVADAWDGTQWKPAAIPNPAGAYNALNAVSCVSAASCLAVGYNAAFPDSDANVWHALAEAWNGSSWGVVATAPPGPLPPGQANAGYGPRLDGVSCTPVVCVAVGARGGAPRIERGPVP